MKYYNSPPKPSYRFGNIPEFMRRWYQPNKVTLSTRYVLALVEWAEKEFADIYAGLISSNNEKMLKIIKYNKIDCLYFLSQTKEFDKLVRDMDTDMWDAIPRSIQNTLIKTYDYYMQRV